MSMNVSTSGSDEAMCDVNTTPLIDVMLVMLVMLIITLPPSTHAVKLDMPRPPKDPPPPSEFIDIEIDFDGTVIYNGTPVSGIASLDSYFKQEAAKDPQPEIHLRPDRRAKYDVVANVMASAQRNHMEKMGFTNVSEFRD
jgi:biopolymer transport protein ExbD